MMANESRYLVDLWDAQPRRPPAPETVCTSEMNGLGVVGVCVGNGGGECPEEGEDQVCCDCKSAGRAPFSTRPQPDTRGATQDITIFIIRGRAQKLCTSSGQAVHKKNIVCTRNTTTTVSDGMENTECWAIKMKGDRRNKIWIPEKTTQWHSAVTRPQRATGGGAREPPIRVTTPRGN